MTSYYNEIDPRCTEVLQRHIDDGSLSAGYVDGRSIEEVRPDDLAGYNEAHFFAGIGGFALGFTRARIPDTVTVWTGGFPCQDLSVAGKRAGLAGSRSGLYFEFQRLVATCLPEFVVIENVPGLLSSNAGRDFAIVIGGLTGIVPDVPEDGWGSAGFFRGIVYSVAYRVLDAQYFGLAQRRRRVFIVASAHSGRAAEVLFERESRAGDTPPVREAGKAAPTLFASGAGTDRTASAGGEAEFCVPVAMPLRAGRQYSDMGNGNTNVFPATAPALTGSGRGVERTGESRGQDPVVAFVQNISDEVRLMNGDGQIAGALSAEPGMKQQSYVMAHGQANAEIISDGSPSLTVNHEAPIAFQVDGSEQAATLRGFGHGWQGQHNDTNAVMVATFDPVNVTSKANRTRVEPGLPANTLHSAGMSIAQVAPTLEAEYFKKRYSNQQFFSQNGDGFPVTVMAHGQANAEIVSDGEPSLTVNHEAPIAFQVDGSEQSATLRGFGHGWQGQHNSTNSVVQSVGVRRLTPVECERLQGFPDNWTDEQADSSRYRQLGNAVAVPCAEWIGRRIVEAAHER